MSNMPSDELYPTTLNTILIEDVITHICKFLDVLDLKNAGLVSHLWRDASLTELKKRTFVTLDLNSSAESSEKINFYPTSLIISDPRDTATPVLLALPLPFDFQLTRLKLGYSSAKILASQIEFCRQLLKNSASTLQELNISNLPNHFSEIPEVSDGIVFPKMKKFTISYCIRAWESISRAIKLLEKFSNLDYLNLNAGNLHTMLGKREGLLKCSLRSISHLTLRDYTDAKHILGLLQLPCKLKTIKFEGVYFVSYKFDGEDSMQVCSEVLYQFFKKHSATLEKLDICREATDCRDRVLMKLILPTLPVLKRLQIDGDYIQSVVFEEISGHFGPIHYARNLPCLESLEVLMIRKNNLASLDSFFPNDLNIVVPSVKNVNLVCTRHQLSIDEAWSHARARFRLLGLFPNARASIMKLPPM